MSFRDAGATQATRKGQQEQDLKPRLSVQAFILVCEEREELKREERARNASQPLRRNSEYALISGAKMEQNPANCPTNSQSVEFDFQSLYRNLKISSFEVNGVIK